jgi:hypothetical protein
MQNYMLQKVADQGPIISSRSLSETYTIPRWEEKAFDAYYAMSGLLITLGTALLGALGYLLINARQAVPQLRHGASAVGSALFAVLSIYFGFLCNESVMARAFSLGFNPYSLDVQYPLALQFYTLLLAVFLFADFSFHELRQGGSN